MLLFADTTPNVPAELGRAFAVQGGWAAITNNLTAFFTNLALAIGILVITLWAAGRLSKVARTAVSRVQRSHQDATIQGLVASLVRWTVILIGMIAVLQQLGVQTTSVLAVLGAASLAIGLALQGTLSNVAAGVMILILRPYRVGDTVVINGQTGEVRSFDLFVTRLTGPDGQQVFMPNGKAFSETILNYSTLGRRRIQLDFGVDYSDDLGRGRRIAIAVASAHPKVLSDPAPWAHVTALDESSVKITLRAWALPMDYGEVYSDLIMQVKAAFEDSGLSFPYPHQVSVLKPDPESDVSAETPPAPARQPSAGRIAR
jgi:small conductance mechanosensitive channel